MLRQKWNIPDLVRGIVHISYNRYNRQCCIFFKSVVFLSTENAKYWPILASFWPILAILSKIYALFGLNRAMVYQI